MKKIVVVGSSNLDMIIRAQKLPRPGETIIGGEFLTAHGGKGANQAVAAARAGGDVAFVSAVGGDTFGEELIAGYILDAISTQFVFKESDAATGVAMIAVAANGENSIIVAPGANALLSPSHLPEIAGVIDNAALVLLQLEIPIETVEAVADYAFTRSIPVILNPAPALSLSDSLLSHVTCITPNETEAKMLTGISVNDEASAARAGEWFHSMGVKTVIITMGSRGAFLHSENESTLIPSFAVKPVDTTAAGDAFNGAFAVALAEGMPLQDAVRFGNAAAAISIMTLGAQPSIPKRAIINAMLQR
jgi:ribokinase